ncbi:hypothetical protein [Mycoplasma bradburyae]|uniref:DUF6856 family protein n=1 Tax=Mycoplasma bradburyae TaxID=2963128 RepID=UPI0020CD008B|nr:hypothetical protein [Mycoplasma bradburyae]MDC4163558.1 hypothetical protein [Mycoplasma bradburyae]MDC4184342.1 hypothetical protein [Mycoplasma bradburyae]UTS70999.1 hypothetical protein NMG77_00805 [Mycoplasma bradburyae]
MNKNKIVSKLTGLASLAFGLSFALTSCTVATSPGFFKVVSAEDVNNKVSLQSITNELKSPVQTAVYGTNLINNGDYVLTILTNTDPAQNYFIDGGDLSSGLKWEGPYARAIKKWQPPQDNPSYKDGILFLLYRDELSDQRAPSNQLNPFSKYPDKKNDDKATKEEKDRSNQYVRNDQSAKTYREIVEFLVKTYPEQTSGWLNRVDGTTKIMNIAFTNDGSGKITPHFYMGSSAPANKSFVLQSSTIQNHKLVNQDLTIDDSFSSFLAGVYTRS